MINLDYQSRVTIYEQIINQIERFVALGILKPKDQIPSIRDLAAQIGINPNTVRKSYSELENMGIINTISTKGTFIADNTDMIIKNKVDKSIEAIKEMILELQKLGLSKEEILKKLK